MSMLVSPLNASAIEVSGLFDTVATEDQGSTQYINNVADMAATLYDPAGVAVPGFTGVAMAYVAASNGKYRGTLDGTLNPKPGVVYRLVITATVAGLPQRWEIPVAVGTRQN
jgi:hypothetical protein